ncbi:beta-N-acetylhexosaminidase [Micromonospora sp. WMMD710]|uniref:beta-N-acetylhexosaminidase n=1 Tax=Micromonospora sp. WMMD710 TaxID=3016085 RepID=UPI00241672FE|nr:beta-N-acetylhexosaminidase [Micromonospora sp. WMMD710]MDG4758004.1 beta-N-acetylhexosaminidase [Micromonospora sp. WMMD710]
MTTDHDEGLEVSVRRRHTTTRLLAIAALALPLTLSAAPAVATPSTPARQLTDVIPAPVDTRPDARAAFRLSPLTVIRTAPGSSAAWQVGRQLADTLRPATGYPLPVLPVPSTPLPEIALVLGGADHRVGQEGYQLDVTRRGVTIRATTPAGLFAGTQTLRQLLPADIEAPTRQRTTWTIPGGRIIDYPRFAYRGAMLDLARHFHTVDEITAYVDLISQYKINYLHLHLTDDQGWRIQIDSWPRLTTVGGGPGTGVDGVGPGYLTKADYQAVVAYAAARHVTIVPEIDMPGHTNAAQSTYPELNCDGVAPPPRTDIAVGYSSLCINDELTYRFVEDVIRELAAITPGPYLHIGGDEAHATTDEDYRTFMNRVLPLVSKYGKRASGWNEIAQADPPADAVAQFWGTGTTNADLVDAVTRGTKVIMSPANKSYLDMKYDATTRLGLRWAGLIEVSDAYGWDPATRVTGVGESAVLGVEAPLWSETLRSLDDIEYMAFPRLPAIAELGWSTTTSHDWESFRTRLGEQAPRWRLQQVDFYPSPQVPWI